MCAANGGRLTDRIGPPNVICTRQNPSMLVVRGTKKFLARVGRPAAEDVTSSTSLGPWYATLFYWRPQVALFVNEQTLFPVLVPLAPATGVIDRFRGHLAEMLTGRGCAKTFVDAELLAMEEHVLAKTQSRSVLGVMNDFKHMAEAYRFEGPVPNLDELASWLASSPCGPLSQTFGTPEDALCALTGASATLVPGRTAIGAQAAARLYQLRAAIRDIEPPVWRRVVVTEQSTLSDLHRVLQAAFGWWDCHLHEFEIEGVRYGIDDGEDWNPPKDERRTRLGDVLRDGGSFVYLYDFGDLWQHDIEVEQLVVADPGQRHPACIGGARACPPEDCGGTSGYAELLEAIADPGHEEHESSLAWVGGDFDPEAYDANAFHRSPHLRPGRRQR